MTRGPEALHAGSLEVLGLLPYASNYTLLAKLQGGDETLVVYKPRRGETPLWDFPTGTLCQREVAAYLVASAAGWDFVPPTILRDGPLGEGAVQLFIDHDPSVTAFDLSESHEALFQQIALFDLMINNGDRKAGHVFADAEGRVRVVDHGVSFHADPKLRTVLWDFIGQPIDSQDLAAVEGVRNALAGKLSDSLAPLLEPEEIAALISRVEFLLASKVFPAPGPGRPYPWPPV